MRNIFYHSSMIKTAKAICVALSLSFLSFLGPNNAYSTNMPTDPIEINVAITSFPQGQFSEPNYRGSRLFKECQELTGKDIDWKDVTTKTSALSGEEIWEAAWNDFGYKQKRKLNEVEGNFTQLMDFYTEFNSSLSSFRNQISKCEAMRSLTKRTDFNDSESRKSGKMATQKSVDGKIKCESAGPETQDYKPCLKALQIYNGALVGTAVFTQVQEVKYQGDSMESVSGMDPNDPTAGLKAQKKDIEGRANMTNQRAGLDVVKAGGLWATMSSIPDHSDLHKACSADSSAGRISAEHIRDKALELIKVFYSPMIMAESQPITITFDNQPGEMPTGSPTAHAELIERKMDDAEEIAGGLDKIGKYCRQALNSAPELLLNQQARQGLKSAMIAAGIDGVKHKLTADQLNKQADQVGKVIDEINEFNPEELPQFQGQDFEGSECDFDPSAEGCDDFVEERSFGFQDSGPLQIHGMENASSFRRGEDPEGTNGDDSASGGSVDRSGAPKPIGIFDDPVAKKSGFDGRMPGAADVSNDGPASANGGGGGGAAGGGGSPPPSQVPQQKDGEEGPRMSDSGDSRAAYSGGGGSLRRTGGGGAMGRGASDDDEEGNPFSELFGDKDPTKSDNLSFRETASEESQINTPDTSIFEIISDRYANVQQEDRLLKYNVQNPDELQ